jgi:hypothetical protein
MVVTDAPGKAAPFMSTCNPFTQARDKSTVSDPLAGIIEVELNNKQNRSIEAIQSPSSAFMLAENIKAQSPTENPPSLSLQVLFSILLRRRVMASRLGSNPQQANRESSPKI